MAALNERLAIGKTGATLDSGLAERGGVGVSMRFFVFLPLMAAIACADEASMVGGKFEAGGDTATPDDSLDTADQADSGAEDTFVPTRMSFEATATIAGGVPTLEGLSAHFLLADATGARTTCADIDLTDAAVTDPPTPDSGAELHAWWTVSDAAASGCEEWPLSASLGFGLGELDPNVRAYLGTVNLEDRADELFGAWFTFGGVGSTVTPFPFGYADVVDPVATDAPLPDGHYTLSPLLVVAIDTE